MNKLNMNVVLAIVVLVTITIFLFTGSQAVLASDSTRLDDGISPVGEPVMTMTDCNTITEISKVECEALVALYDSTNGGSWTNHSNWKTNNTPCDSTDGWYGVKCDGSTPKQVIQLVLNQNNLAGPIPTQIGNLVHVNYLNLASNSITGTIPTTIGDMSAMLYLYLEYNDLTGSIPPNVAALSNLRVLNLTGNQLSGSIPKEIGSLTSLYQLELAWNELSGAIPTELGGMTDLIDMVLLGNNLDGPIPLSLGGLSNLEWLMLYDNQLTGSIPQELGSLGNLTTLYLQENQLSGSIPPQLGSLSELRKLYLDHNLLTGSIPAQLGSLSKLNYLYLNDNQLSDSIPDELGNMAELRYLYLYNNQLSGSLPSELGNLSKLQGLHLYDNEFSGNLPTKIGNLSSLQELILYNNQFSGSLPVSFTSLLELTNFQYHDTNLCTPTGAAFQTWLASVGNVSGTWDCLAGPTLLSPAQLSRTKDTTPKFTWQKQMTGEKYQITVDNNSDFLSPVLNAYGLVNPFKTFPTALAQGAYYWRVRAVDPGGNWSPWSTKWKFVVDTTPPVKPTLLSPANGSTTTDRTPTFTWKAVTGAKYYQLVIDDNANFSSPVFTSAWMTGTSKTLGTALAPKLYYWRVRAKDAVGNVGAWSSAWKVTIK